jgi:class 3 adenylate cyclase
MPSVISASESLRGYVPRLLIDWLRETPQERWRVVEGTLVFADISGFTGMTERLARRGKVGAEEISDLLSGCLAPIITVAARHGGDLLKWGGDAVLLLFDGPGDAARACRAAAMMRQALRDVGVLRSSAGAVRVRISVGIHTGVFCLVLSDHSHTELLICGRDVSRTILMQQAANVGEILVSDDTARALAPGMVGEPHAGGRRLRRVPDAPQADPPLPPLGGVDLTRCLSRPVREHLLEDPDSAEHRRITAAFIEFAGTDQLFATAGAPGAQAALDQLVVTTQSACDAEQVTFLETDIGNDAGKIMLISGAPACHGDNEERMLRCVRRILDADQPLALRAGVNAGAVFAGGFGLPERRTFSVKGDAVNLAARLMSRAGPGQMLATSEVVNRSAQRFELIALAPFSVKGKSRPVEASVVGAPIAAVRHDARNGPMVGRERELATLRGALGAARSGHGRLVEIVGEPGIGKSRLVQELVTDAADAWVVTVACERYESAIPYAALRRLVRTAAGIADDADSDEATTMLWNAVPASGTPWMPLIGVAAGVVIRRLPRSSSGSESNGSNRPSLTC